MSRPNVTFPTEQIVSIDARFDQPRTVVSITTGPLGGEVDFTIAPCDPHLVGARVLISTYDNVEPVLERTRLGNYRLTFKRRK